MTTRKAGTVASVNRRIDALIKRNPVKIPIVSFGSALKDTSGPDAMRSFGDYWFVQWRRITDEKWTTQKLRDSKSEAESYARSLKRQWDKDGSDSELRIVRPSPATGNFRRNPTQKTKLVAMNPAKRVDDIPGDFSQSSAKVYGRAWTDATNASITDVGSDAVVRITWKDGEWLQMVFDSRAGAVKCLHALGFK